VTVPTYEVEIAISGYPTHQPKIFASQTVLGGDILSMGHEGLLGRDILDQFDRMVYQGLPRRVATLYW
jgi:hypothetical protein